MLLEAVAQIPITESIMSIFISTMINHFAKKLLPMQDFFTNLALEAQHFDGSNRQKILSMLEELEGIF